MPLTVLLGLLPTIISSGSELYGFVQRVRETAKQRGEWTPEAELIFQQRVDAAENASHWQPSRE